MLRKLPQPRCVLSILSLLLAAVLLQSCATSGLGRRGQQQTAGRVVVITGASSGFGRGVAEQLGSYGASVVLAARRTELLEEIAGRIRAAGGKALVVTTDVSKPADLERLAAAAVKEFGHIDVWMNNAGVEAIGAVWEIPLEDQMRVIDVNLKGVIYGSHAAIGQFRKQGYGVLINTGSLESEVPLAYQGAYAASKAAILSYDRSLRQELRLAGYGRKIRVTTIMPWAADTPIWGHGANYSGGTARMAMLDKPGKVVNAMSWATRHRKSQIAVGWKAKVANTSHRILPRFTERLASNVAHRYMKTTAPPAPPTKGNLYAPMESGTGVSDGVKERIRRENKERRERKRNK